MFMDITGLSSTFLFEPIVNIVSFGIQNLKMLMVIYTYTNIYIYFWFCYKLMLQNVYSWS